MTDKLNIDTAWHSITGLKSHNEDSAGVHVPEDPYLALNKGITLVVAMVFPLPKPGRRPVKRLLSDLLMSIIKPPTPGPQGTVGRKSCRRSTCACIVKVTNLRRRVKVF